MGIARLIDLPEALTKGGSAYTPGWVMRFLLDGEYAYYCKDEHGHGRFFKVSVMLAGHGWWQRRGFGLVVCNTADDDEDFAEVKRVYRTAETVAITVEPALVNVDVHL